MVLLLFTIVLLMVCPILGCFEWQEVYFPVFLVER
uniref:Uncharacterized protein n=1 Tax=Rhizophora mucronata TaxID=61149 RepID=A0A2P2JG55_RHIMU